MNDETPIEQFLQMLLNPPHVTNDMIIEACEILNKKRFTTVGMLRTLSEDFWPRIELPLGTEFVIRKALAPRGKFFSHYDILSLCSGNLCLLNFTVHSF